MKVTGTKNHKGNITITEALKDDPFEMLAGSEARVSATVGRSVEYGDVKCSFAVTVNCPQQKACLDKAAELCFETALEYVNDAMSILAPGLPPIVKE